MDNNINENKASLSPRVQKTEEPIGASMNFFDALKLLSLGKKITREEWEDEKCYGILSEGRVKLHKADGTLHEWIISDGDLAGEDWKVVWNK